MMYYYYCCLLCLRTKYQRRCCILSFVRLPCLLFVVQAYGDAISGGGEEEGIARSNRAAAYLKVGKPREALQDASVAVRLKPTEIAFYRKG